MQISYPITDVSPADWTLVQFKTEIRRVMMSKLGGDAATEHMLRISYVIFLLCAFFGRPAARVRVASIFRVKIHHIARRLGTPTSPVLVAEATEALNLLREHAAIFGCHGDSTSTAHPRVCPSCEADREWLRWVPTFNPNFLNQQSDQTTN